MLPRGYTSQCNLQPVPSPDKDKRLDVRKSIQFVKNPAIIKNEKTIEKISE